MDKTIKKYFPIFLLPTLVAFIIGFLIPFISGIYLSFCNFTSLLDAEFIGTSNYRYVFTDDDTFIHSLKFTTAFTIVSVISINLLAFIVAMLLTKGIKGTKLFRTVFFAPNLVGGIILGYIWQLVINGVLLYFDRTITYSAAYGFWGLIIQLNWQQVGYMMIIYIAGIQNIPVELIEAAKIDGANSRQMIKGVIIPMLMPAITICTFLTLTNGYKLFDQNLTLTAGAPSQKTEMLALNIYNTFYYRAGWQGIGQAKAVIFFVLVGIIALIQLVLTRRKEVQQ